MTHQSISPVTMDALINAIDSPTVAALENVFNGPGDDAKSYSELIVEILAPRLIDAAAKPWKCMAVSKAACAWPDCGCDPEATKVIQALVDQEWQAPNDAQGSPDVEQLRSELATSRDMCTKFEAAVGDDVGTILQLREQVEKLAAALRGFIPEDSVLDDCDCDDCRPVNEALALLRDVSLPSTDQGGK